MSDDDLVSPSWVARTAGVTPSTVSNWQQRHADFPSRVGDTGRFDRAAVLEWLAGRGIQIAADPDSGRAAWSIFDAVRGMVPPAEIVLAVTRAVVLEHLRRSAIAGIAVAKSNQVRLEVPVALATQDESAPAILSWIRLVHPAFMKGLFGGPDQPGSRELLLRISPLLRDQDDLLDVVDSLIARERGLGRNLGFVSSKLLGTSMAGFLPQSVDTVLDLAVGYGIAALSVARSGKARVIIGCDIDVQVGQVFLGRALLAGIDAVLLHADSLLMTVEFRALADVVLASPPFGVPLTEQHREFAATTLGMKLGSRDADLLWIRIAEEARRPHGTAIVHSTPTTTFRSGVAADFRADLIQSKDLAAVVGLPPGFVEGSSIQSALLVLTDHLSVEEVIFIDASELAPDAAGRAIGERRVVEPGPKVVTVPREDLLDARASISPRRWTERRFDGVDRAQVRGLNQRLAALPRLQGATVRPAPALIPSANELVTVRDLIDRRSLKFWRGSLTGSDVPDLGVQVADAKWVARPGTMPTRSIPQVRVPHDNFMLRSGDLLVARGNNGVHAHLWRGTERTVVGSGVYLVRVTDESLDPEFLQLCMLSRSNRRFAEGDRLRDLEVEKFVVPVASRRQQQAAVEAWRSMQARVEDLTAATNQVKWATVDLLDALTSGAGIDE